MAYTTHGHQIPNSPVEDFKPTGVARCGGTSFCQGCQAEAEAYHAEPKAEATFEDRNIELCQIKRIDDGGGAITMTNGWSMGFDDLQADKIEVGDYFILEKKGFNRITGFMLLSLEGGEWLWHHSDQHIQAQEEEWRRKDRERRQKFLEEHREELEVREAALPEVLRKRLENFRNHGGEGFDLGGWGYELIVCELIVLYAASAGDESEKIDEFAKMHGTTGNQHDYAKAAAKFMGTEDEEKLSGSVSALAPLTGDADYSDAGKSV